jgi:hypothetical protein
MDSESPSNPEEPKPGFFKAFFTGFFDDFTVSDWIEFALYAVGGISLVVIGVNWLIGRF